VLFAANLYEHFVQVVSVTKTLMLSPQPTRKFGSEFVYPESDCLVADRNIAFCE
jgi:hypothetical protein